MSIQKNTYTSKKTGKTKTEYYASVWFAEEKRSIIGPMRPSIKLASQDQTDIQRDIATGRAKANKAKRATTVDEVYTLWHEATKPPTYANSTWRTYERFYRDYIQETFGSVAIGKVTPIHIQKYVNIIKEKYEPATVNKIINILSNIFSFATAPLKCIASNPVSEIKRCKVPNKKKIVWTDDMIIYFLSLPRVKESNYYSMLCLSAALGARPGEVCGLRESALISTPTYAIDFDRGYDNWEHETDMKTSGSHRTPPIPKYLYKIIYKQLLRKRETRLAIPNWGDNDYLFVSPNGNPIKPRQYARAFKRLLTAHNAAMEEILTGHGELPKNNLILPEMTLYGFRTSFATNNMRRHPNAALISSIMGNSPKTLLQFYAQSDTEMQMELITGYMDLQNSSLMSP